MQLVFGHGSSQCWGIHAPADGVALGSTNQTLNLRPVVGCVTVYTIFISMHWSLVLAFDLNLFGTSTLAVKVVTVRTGAVQDS